MAKERMKDKYTCDGCSSVTESFQDPPKGWKRADIRQYENPQFMCWLADVYICDECFPYKKATTAPEQDEARRTMIKRLFKKVVSCLS